MEVGVFGRTGGCVFRGEIGDEVFKNDRPYPFMVVTVPLAFFGIQLPFS